jgi:hypothetical protein
LTAWLGYSRGSEVAGIVLLMVVSLVMIVVSLTDIWDRAEAKRRGDRNIHGVTEASPLFFLAWLALLIWCVVKLATG